MHWCCTERPTRPGQADAYVGDRPVIESLAEEIEALVGPDVFVEITRPAARDTDVDRGGPSAPVEQPVARAQGDSVTTDPLVIGPPHAGQPVAFTGAGRQPPTPPTPPPSSV